MRGSHGNYQKHAKQTNVASVMMNKIVNYDVKTVIAKFSFSLSQLREFRVHDQRNLPLSRIPFRVILNCFGKIPFQLYFLAASNPCCLLYR